MHPQDALIVITLPTRAHPLLEGRQRGERLEAALDDLLRAVQLGHVAGYAAGEGRREVQVLVDQVAWEAAWEVIRAALARSGLLGAATVRLQIAEEQAQQTLWPPPARS